MLKAGLSFSFITVLPSPSNQLKKPIFFPNVLNAKQNGAPVGSRASRVCLEGERRYASVRYADDL